MKINIQSLDFPLTDALRAHVKRRLGFAINVGENNIRRIIVRLTDINGPKGGADKRCKIHIIPNRLSDVVVEDTQADLYLAINRAVQRAGRTLSRRLSRQHKKGYYSVLPDMNKVYCMT